MENNSLNTKAMLVSLSISMWRCRRRDKKVTRETNQRYGAGDKAGNYNKNLMPIGEDNAYQAIDQAAATAYFHFREQTMPWLDDGTRILTAANYLPYMQIERKDRAAFDKAVAQFKIDLPDLIKRAELILGPRLFNPAEYPTPANINGKFGFSVKIFPLPASEDFRVALQGQEVSEIRKQIEQETKNAVTEAMRDVWERVYNAVSHFREKAKDGVVKQAMLDNLRELCDLLPRLNLINDPKLDEMRARIERQLGSYDAGDLKTGNKKTRKQAVAEASRIEADLAAFMGGGQ